MTHSFHGLRAALVCVSLTSAVFAGDGCQPSCSPWPRSHQRMPFYDGSCAPYSGSEGTLFDGQIATPYSQDPNAQPNTPITDAFANQAQGQASQADGNFFALSETSTERATFDTSIKGDFFAGIALAQVFGQPTASGLSVAGGDRRFKFTDNLSPFPTDRVFYNYNYFNDATVDINGRPTSVARHVFGLEKTFMQKMFSVEVRVPFASGLNSTQILGQGDTTGTEFGNMTLAAKARLFNAGKFSSSAGLGVVLPTASSAVFDSGSDFMEIRNEAVHLLPLLGAQYRPTQKSWITAATHFDFATSGNRVTSTSGIANGSYRDQSLWFLDAQTGYWLWQDVEAGNGLAGFVELHYTTTIENDSTVGIRGIEFVGNPFNRLDMLNLTTGFQVLAWKSTTLSLFSVNPLRSGEEAPFDYELGLQLNYNY